MHLDSARLQLRDRETRNEAPRAVASSSLTISKAGGSLARLRTLNGADADTETPCPFLGARRSLPILKFWTWNAAALHTGPPRENRMLMYRC